MDIIIAGMIALLVIIRPLLYPDPAFVYFDDFYYYLVPAQHYLATGSFAFFPGVATNGFQPLWMLVITILLAVAGNGAFFVVLNSVTALLLYAAFYQSVRLANEQGVQGWLAWCAGFAVLAVQLNIATCGMEVALTVPLLLALTRLLLNRPLSAASAPQLLCIGLLGSLSVLARLNAAVLLLPAAILFWVKDRPSGRAVLLIVLGALPLWGYFILNHALSGMWMPVSGHAKQLKESLWPTIKPLIGLMRLNGVMLISFIAFPLLALAAIVRGHGLVTRSYALLPVCLAGVVLYYAVYAVLSDWQFWIWYGYPLAWLAGVSIINLSRQKDLICVITEMLCPLLLLAAIWTVLTRTPEDNAIYRTSLTIQAFAHEHPGRYAMGDCAGTVGYLLNGQVLQLEGLMGDSEFLDTIRNDTPLRDVLRHYHIDYYIVYNPMRRGECYEVREPAHASAISHAMRGHICQKPLMVDATDGVTMIFPADAVEE